MAVSFRKVRKASMLCGTAVWIGASMPVLLTAQTKCTSFACKVRELAKKLDSATTPGASGGRGVGSVSAGIDMSVPSGPIPEIGATGSTGGVRFQAIVLQWKVIDDGTQLRVPPPPAAPEIRRQLLGCGPDRACVASADLRVIGIDTYGQSLADNLPFTVDVSLENHGRRATGTTEGLICVNGISGARCNDGLSDTFVIPVLQPGERVTIRRSLSGKLTDYVQTRQIGVIVDPDESIADFSRQNNTILGKDMKVEKPEMTIVQQKMPPAATTDRSFQPVHIVRIQNPSRALATGQIPMTVKITGYNTSCRTTYPNEPLTLPSLPPKAVVEFAIVFPRLFASCSENAQWYTAYEAPADSPNGLSISGGPYMAYTAPNR